MVMPQCKTFLKIQCLDESEGFDLIWEKKLINRKAYFREASLREKQNILLPIKSTTVGPNDL